MLRFLFVLALTLSSPAWAEEPPLVDFSSEVSREIGNDLLVARLSVDAADRSAAQVASQLTGMLNISLRKAEGFPGVIVSSGTQATMPVYGKGNQITGWRGHADLHLESKDFKAAGQLIAQLQESIQLAGVSFSLAPETRQLVQNSMVVEAMSEFRKRAKVVTEAMNARDYKIRHLTIEDGGNGGMLAMQMMRTSSDASPTTPDFAAGTTQVTVRVAGTVEIH